MSVVYLYAISPIESMTTLEKWQTFSTNAKAQLKTTDALAHNESFIQYNCEPSFESYFNIIITWKENEAAWHKKTWDIWKDHEHYFERDHKPKALVIDIHPTILHESGTLQPNELEALQKMIRELQIVPVIDRLRMFTLDGALHSIAFGVDAVRSSFSWHTLPEGWADLEMIAGYLVKLCGHAETLSESLRSERTGEKDNIIRIDNSSDIDLENIQGGVLIVHATWSGPSIVNTRQTIQALQEQNYKGQIIVVDNDCMLPDFQMNLFGELCHGWGEIFLISNGVIAKKYTGRESYMRFIKDRPVIVKRMSYFNMVTHCRSFEQNSKKKKKPHSVLEFKIASQVNSEIEQLQQLTIDDVKRLIAIVNDVNEEDYYSGYSWMHYKMSMAGFLKENGYSVKFEDGILVLEE
jgi:hypothetical protein